MPSALRPACIALLVALSVGIAGCVTREPRSASAVPAATAAAVSAVCDRLYFGRSIPGGGEVTEAQWTAFVTTEVAARFPAGFTTYPAAGHWRGDDGVEVSEQTTILEIVHVSEPVSDRALDDIARIYCRRFNQEAVMRVRIPAEQTFLRR